MLNVKVDSITAAELMYEFCQAGCYDGWSFEVDHHHMYTISYSPYLIKLVDRFFDF